MAPEKSKIRILHLRIASQTFFLFTAILGIFGVGMTGFIYPYFFCPASPGACAGCPIWVIEHGTIEILSGSSHGAMMLLYLLGLFLVIGAFVGRSFCGWACPVGSLQDMYSFLRRKMDSAKHLMLAGGIAIGMVLFGGVVPFVLRENNVEPLLYMWIGYMGAIGSFIAAIVGITAVTKYRKPWLIAIFIAVGGSLLEIHLIWENLDLGSSPFSSIELMGLMSLMFVTIGIVGLLRWGFKDSRPVPKVKGRVDWGFRLVKVGVLLLIAPTTWYFDTLAFTDIDPIGGITATIPELFLNPTGWAGNQFFWYKAVFVFGVIALVALVDRGWCRYLCPIGAMYGPTNKMALTDIDFIEDKCIHCQLCIRDCPMGINPKEAKTDPECVRCGRCIDVCPAGAQKFVLFNRKVRGVFGR
ncbi:MAG: 4Fe-4S binding protein [Thermoplasmatota archaeon]